MSWNSQRRWNGNGGIERIATKRLFIVSLHRLEVVLMTVTSVFGDVALDGGVFVGVVARGAAVW